MNRPLRVAFVGMKRPSSDMPVGYWPTFVRYHLELPYYYAMFGNTEVTLTTVERVDYHESFTLGGSIRCMTEGEYRDCNDRFDVVVHWRKWFDDLCDPFARNVILSQDHSYGSEWLENVGRAFGQDHLDGILVFPAWHKERVRQETGLPIGRLYEGLTLGVDTSVYHPDAKDPYQLLWASDPGRGLDRLVVPFLRLWERDRRFRLTVTYPDYVRPESLAPFSSFLSHPGVRHLPGVRNGAQLWSLFNSSGILPYSSTFPEPSSRCHRQAMAAGSLVLYPPNMGTPSDLLENGLTGIVEHPEAWPDIIRDMVSSGRWQEIGRNARTLAINENWAVQAHRFHNFFSKGIDE